MAEEGDVRITDSDGSCPQSPTPETGALVEVTFQKDPNQKYKYLEAEPKALGITQIMLTVFMVNIRLAVLEADILSLLFGVLILFGLVAGGVAIGAQNLHLPTLKACLGVQIVLCIMSVIYFMCSMGLLFIPDEPIPTCHDSPNETSQTNWCYRAQAMFNHVLALEVLVVAAQISLSATLAAFCCKVIQCCSPRTSMPIIAVNTVQAPQ